MEESPTDNFEPTCQEEGLPGCKELAPGDGEAEERPENGSVPDSGDDLESVALREREHSRR